MQAATQTVRLRQASIASHFKRDDNGWTNPLIIISGGRATGKTTITNEFLIDTDGVFDRIYIHSSTFLLSSNGEYQTGHLLAQGAWVEQLTAEALNFITMSQRELYPKSNCLLLIEDVSRSLFKNEFMKKFLRDHKSDRITVIISPRYFAGISKDINNLADAVVMTLTDDEELLRSRYRSVGCGKFMSFQCFYQLFRNAQSWKSFTWVRGGSTLSDLLFWDTHQYPLNLKDPLRLNHPIQDNINSLLTPRYVGEDYVVRYLRGLPASCSKPNPYIGTILRRMRAGSNPIDHTLSLTNLTSIEYDEPRYSVLIGGRKSGRSNTLLQLLEQDKHLKQVLVFAPYAGNFYREYRDPHGTSYLRIPRIAGTVVMLERHPTIDELNRNLRSFQYDYPREGLQQRIIVLEDVKIDDLEGFKQFLVAAKANHLSVYVVTNHVRYCFFEDKMIDDILIHRGLDEFCRTSLLQAYLKREELSWAREDQIQQEAALNIFLCAPTQQRPLSLMMPGDTHQIFRINEGTFQTVQVAFVNKISQ